MSEEKSFSIFVAKKTENNESCLRSFRNTYIFVRKIETLLFQFTIIMEIILLNNGFPFGKVDFINHQKIYTSYLFIFELFNYPLVECVLLVFKIFQIGKFLLRIPQRFFNKRNIETISKFSSYL